MITNVRRTWSKAIVSLILSSAAVFSIPTLGCDAPDEAASFKPEARSTLGAPRFSR